MQILCAVFYRSFHIPLSDLTISALFWHKSKNCSLVLSCTNSELGIVLIYVSLLNIASRVLNAPNLHATATVFLELLFANTGAMVK